ncbi:MAG: hypothetical protein E5Y88_28380 [Mesorhizobium sp.]|uniref:Uncharacterized protein n=2 Tax=Mesorhizobium TaxID=68287 RepID=A0AB36QZX8_9HYPH|nr:MULTISPECIES: hypothetical protein [Mesorhizobium]PAP97837.1 hypothetical protein CIT25_33920 [Mesorhizobium mediterraneum]QIA25951.1 hypothetical protein A9K68_020065 [Mesorhizobium sp. AA22]RVB80198.1 hypothetical protein EN885_02855 [Mesorhizobium sp. M6A.T.Cr.TU.014.01.1.1]RWN31826.1 MAG: hypothetical protein EOR96_29795 [Mesorhizobium sp.]RWP73833.1 MAG: hypothetical protein EOR09_17700 [Mesorhizobium sp.]
MRSDFAAARELLECAQNRLCGMDETSQRVSEALDSLIEEIAIAEFRKAPLTVVPFPRARPPKHAR